MSLKLEYWRLKENITNLLKPSEDKFTRALQDKVNYIKWLQSKGTLTDFQKKAIEKDLNLIKAAEEYFGQMHHALGLAIREHDAANEISSGVYASLDKMESDYLEVIKERNELLRNQNGNIQPAA